MMAIQAKRCCIKYWITKSAELWSMVYWLFQYNLSTSNLVGIKVLKKIIMKQKRTTWIYIIKKTVDWQCACQKNMIEVQIQF